MNKSLKSTSSQSQRFVAAARELGTDDDEIAFEEALGVVAKAPPHKTASKRKGKPTKK